GTCLCDHHDKFVDCSQRCRMRSVGTTAMFPIPGHAEMEHREAVLVTRGVTRRAIAGDLAVIALVFVLGFVLAGHFDLFEGFTQFVRSREASQLDELLVAAAMLPVVLLVLVLARWR